MITRQYDTKCKIIINGSVAIIQGVVPWSIVINETSYYKAGYQFMPRFKMGQWDGRIKLFNRRTRSFPAGLTSAVRDALKESGIGVTVEEARPMPPLPMPDSERWLEGLELEGVSFAPPYDYQPEVATKMLTARRGIVSVATNGGKTEIACLVTAALRQPTLFIVPGKDLLHQTRARFIKRLRASEHDVGLIGDGKWKPGAWVTIGTAQTLSRALGGTKGKGFLERIQLVFADECHHAGSDQWYQVLKACPAYFRYGLSGTPLKRTDGADMRLIGVTGPVVAEIRNKDLITRGISCEVEVRFLRIDRPDLPDGTPYPDAYKMGIVENPFRNRKLCKAIEEQVDKKKSILVLVREIDHGSRMSNSLWKYGKFVPNQFICGKESSDTRIKALQNFQKRDLPVLIATSIFDEGVDVPNIDVLVLAGSGKSSIKTLQRIGRGLRTGGGSDKLLVIDTADFQNKHLLKHSLQRMEDYKAEECFEITVSP